MLGVINVINVRCD